MPLPFERQLSMSTGSSGGAGGAGIGAVGAGGTDPESHYGHDGVRAREGGTMSGEWGGKNWTWEKSVFIS